MTTIHKYPIEVTDEQSIRIPKDSTILCVQIQAGAEEHKSESPCIWAMVNTESEMTSRKIFIVGTGHPLPLGAMKGAYIGTFQLGGGSLVFHAFTER